MSKSIVFALSSFFPNHRAGTETYVLNLSKELIKLGYKVFVIIPAVGKTSENYEYEGIKVSSFKVPVKVNAKEMNGLEKPSGIYEFKHILQSIEPVIFHLHSLSRSIHAEHIRIANEMGIKTVFTAHLGGTFCVNGDFLLFEEKQCDGKVGTLRCLSCFIKNKSKKSISISKLFGVIIDKLILKSPVKVKYPAFHIVNYKLKQIELLKQHCNINIAIAEWLNDAFKVNGLPNVKVVKQGVDSAFIKTNDKEIKPDNKINLIFVGRMHPDKGVHLLLNALEDNLARFFDLTIVTIPSEDEKEYYHYIKRQFEKLGYKNWFENLTTSAVANKIFISDLLVLPSTKNEAAPLVILEANANRTPVIGSDYIAIKEMINHGIDGLLFKNNSVHSLKKLLKRIIDESDLIGRLSNNITKVRTFEIVAKEHDILYRTLI